VEMRGLIEELCTLFSALGHALGEGAGGEVGGGGSANDGNNRRDNRCNDLRVGNNVNHACYPTCPSAHRGAAHPE